MKLTNETKTGIFVLICLVALMALLIKVGNFTFFKKGYLLRARFPFTGGVKANAPVRLSGVDVGEERAIRLLDEGEETFAEVDLWLENGIRVRKDSKATVSTLGMMGEKYVEIRVGKSAEFAPPNDLLTSEDPVRLEDLIEIGKKVAGDVGDMAKSITKVADHVDDAIQDNRSKLDSIFDNLEETSENFNDFSQDVKYHPWKVLAKGKETPKDQMTRDREAHRAEKARKRGGDAAQAVEIASALPATISEPAPKKSNFSPARG